jgi:hypothetical protein
MHGLQLKGSQLKSNPMRSMLVTCIEQNRTHTSLQPIQEYEFNVNHSNKTPSFRCERFQGNPVETKVERRNTKTRIKQAGDSRWNPELASSNLQLDPRRNPSNFPHDIDPPITNTCGVCDRNEAAVICERSHFGPGDSIHLSVWI